MDMRQDDPSSFEACALPHFEGLLRIARRLTRREHEAEDLVQETFLKAFRAFGRVEMREFGIKPWLLKILHNTFITRSTREQRGPRATDMAQLESDARVDTSAASGLPILPALDLDRLDSEVKTAIDELSPEFRVVLLLWATMEFSYQEVSEILSIPIGTVMSRLHRARQNLAARLGAFAVQNRLASGQAKP